VVKTGAPFARRAVRFEARFESEVGRGSRSKRGRDIRATRAVFTSKINHLQSEGGYAIRLARDPRPRPVCQ
jgi:hypothetical protein